MPNPISRIVRNPKISLRTDVLDDKPEMAVLVSQIFATWSTIEYDLGMLLTNLLGASESPAMAIFSILQTQRLQAVGLQAAAKAVLPSDDYKVFSAATAVAESVSAPRDCLAHWLWGKCEQRPDLLCLANPKKYKSREIDARRYLETPVGASAAPLSSDLIDPDEVLAYSQGDLQRAKRDLVEARSILIVLSIYLNPSFLKTLLTYNRRTGKVFEKVEPSDIRERALAGLKTFRLFNEAFDRV